MTSPDLNKLDALYEAATTDGEWSHVSFKWDEAISTERRSKSAIRISSGDTSANKPLYGTREMAKADAALIVALVNEYPSIRAEMERTKRERADALKMLWIALGDQERIVTDHELASLNLSHTRIERVELDTLDGFVIRRARTALNKEEGDNDT